MLDENTEVIVPKETVGSVVDKAMEGLNSDGTVKTETDKKLIEKVEAKKSSLDQLSDSEKELAAGMLLALKDPEQAPAVIDYLAKQGGYTKAEVKELKETLEIGNKKEVEAAKDEIAELLSEQFGDEFAAKLAPAIKRAVDKGVEEQTKGIKQSHEQQELSRLEVQSTQALDSIAEEFYGKGNEIPKQVTSEMDKLMDTYKPAKDQSLKEYLNDIHALAAARKGGSLKPVDNERTERLNRSRNNPTEKLNSGRSPIPSREDDFEGQVAHIKDPLTKAIKLGELQLQAGKKD